MSQVLRTHAVSRLRYLVQQVDRFERFHAGSARLEINAFTDLFTTDDVLSQIWDALRAHLSVSPKAWHEQANREREVPPLPRGAADCMAFRFATFRYMKSDKADLQHFVSNLFPGSYLNERLMNWKRLIVHPFAADCRTLVRDLPGRLPETEWVQLDECLESYLNGPFEQVGFGPRAWTDADDERAAASLAQAEAATTPAEPVAETSAVEAALAELEACVEAVHSSEREEVLLDLAALRIERRRPTFQRARFLAR
ncbi:MAG TPA: hypothetical protein DEA08_00020, partial [Planctomycetes bacterium]|nr:hypothetical protein [Planctomycetota bacterium]